MSLFQKLLRRNGVKKIPKVYSLTNTIAQRVHKMSDRELLLTLRSHPHPLILTAVSDEIAIRRQCDLESGKVHASF